jgi:hypothetical protein
LFKDSKGVTLQSATTNKFLPGKVNENKRNLFSKKFPKVKRVYYFATRSRKHEK